MGVGIGRLSLGPDFAGVLPWGCLGNRPYLRCLHGAGLCFWRLGFFREAKRVFERMLWMNPSDNQGVRFILGSLAGSSFGASTLSRIGRLPAIQSQATAPRSGV